MPQRPNQSSTKERSIMAIMLVLVLFLSPMTQIWAALNAPWYSPYIVWAIAIFIAWWLQHYLRHDGNEP